MSLMACPECARQVSSSARRCPECGYPVDWPRRARVLRGVLIITAVQIALVSAFVAYQVWWRR